MEQVRLTRAGWAMLGHAGHRTATKEALPAVGELSLFTVLAVGRICAHGRGMETRPGREIGNADLLPEPPRACSKAP